MSDAMSKLMILLEAQDDASPKLKKAGEATRGLGEQLTSIGRIAAGVALGSLGAQLGMDIAEHFKEAITEVENFGNQIYQLQQRIGVSSQSASGLLSVFERFGVSADDADSILTKFSRNLRGQADMSEGGAMALNQFQGTMSELGVSAVDAAGNFRPMEQVLAEVQERMSALQGDGQTGARAMALFGRSGAQLAPVLNLTSEEFKDLQQEAQRLGVTLSQDNVDQVRKLAMAHKDLDEATRGLSIQTGLLVNGPLTELARIAANIAIKLNEDVVGGFKHAAEAYEEYKKRTAGPTSTPEDKNVLTGMLPQAPTGDDVVRALRDAELGPYIDVLHGLIAAGGFIRSLNVVPKLSGTPTNEDIIAAARPKDRPGIQDLLSTGPPLVPPDDAADRAKAAAADAKRDAASRASTQVNLGQAEIAGKREMDVIQHQITVAQRESLDLTRQAAAAELDLIPVKERQADLELQLLEVQNQRAQIEKEAATNRAQLAAMPSSAALEDNQYQQQLIRAQIKAGVISGQGIPAGAIQDLIGLNQSEASLQVRALQAGHAVTLAERDQHRNELETNVATAPTRADKADADLDAATKQRKVDAINAQQQADKLGQTGRVADLTQALRDLEDKLFQVSQKQGELTAPTFNITLNAGTGPDGQPDYDKLIQDLSVAVLGALQKAAVSTASPAPVTVPGAH